MDTCKVGAVIEPEGQLGEYQGQRQMKITAARVVPESEIHFEELLPVSPYFREMQLNRLDRMIGEVADDDLRQFLHLHLVGPYEKWPAAVSYHHAWVGGLLDHSLQVAEVALNIGRQFPEETDPDILIAGALLHDIGKLWEIRMGATFEFTHDGRLYGHVSLGMNWFRDKTSGLSLRIVDELLHIIASHHGTREWGAIVEPKTANAVAVHLADLTSARMEMARAAIMGHTGEDHWTAYDRATKTQYFIPPRADASAQRGD
jgi:3'-5' exoribonuclease